MRTFIRPFPIFILYIIERKKTFTKYKRTTKGKRSSYKPGFKLHIIEQAEAPREFCVMEKLVRDRQEKHIRKYQKENVLNDILFPVMRNCRKIYILG